MTALAHPPLDECGFIRVPTSQPKPLWLTCNACQKSDHFFVRDGVVHCRCGASYDHAVRPNGEQVPASDLTFVPFTQGPRGLADLEWDPNRIAMLVAAAVMVVIIAGFGIYWML